MAKPKETDEQKRAKQLKRARWDVFLSPVVFLGAASVIALEIVQWRNNPNLLHGLGLISWCGCLLYAAYTFAEAKSTLRNGYERSSLGSGAGFIIYLLGRLGEGYCKHGLPTHLWPWLLGIYLALSLGAGIWIIFIFRRLHRTKSVTPSPQGKQ